jgi:1-deoxy-D-xylulose-5-phosphate synthase
MVIVEENVLSGGFGAAVLELLEKAAVSDVKVKRLGIPDEFVTHGSKICFALSITWMPRE